MRLKKIVGFLLTLYICIYSGFLLAVPVSVDALKTIRVLIQERSSENILCRAHSKTGLYLSTDVHERIKITDSGKSPISSCCALSLVVKNGSFYLAQEGKRAKVLKGSVIHLVSGDNHLFFDNKEYRGTITLHAQKENKKILVINELDLEDYVYSVLRSECIPSWPFEIQKVQAVASRSYALYHILASRIRNKLYDIKNTTRNQVYDGHHYIKHLRDAVLQTSKLILTYNNKPALTMFDICCGGVIPAHLSTADKTKPYLFRPYRCLYCKKSAYYSWKATLPHREFLKKLKYHLPIKKKIVSLGVLKNVSTQHHDPSQTTQLITLNGSLKSVSLNQKELKRALPGVIKSPSFTLKKDQDHVHIEGKGFGHHHGLCQCGAFHMVKAGWSYKRILRFYFPRTRLVCYK